MSMVSTPAKEFFTCSADKPIARIFELRISSSNAERSWSRPFRSPSTNAPRTTPSPRVCHNTRKKRDFVSYDVVVSCSCLCFCAFPSLSALACPSPPSPPTTTCTFDGLDFSSLTTADLIGSDGTETYTYALRLCGVVSSNSVCTSDSSSACQIPSHESSTAYDIGNYNAQEAEWSYLNPDAPAEGILLQMQGQDDCFASGGANTYKANIQVRSHVHCEACRQMMLASERSQFGVQPRLLVLPFSVQGLVRVR